MAEAFVAWIHPVTAVLLGAIAFGALAIFFLLPPTPKASEDKKFHAIITGGSSGIGLSLAKECAQAGVKNVTLIARTKSTLEKVQKELSAEYKDIHFHIHPLDISNNFKAVEAAATSIIKTAGGPPTLLFNNAGVLAARAFQDVPIDDFDRLMKCNYLGVVYMCRAFLPSMQSGSSIVLTSSMAGSVGVYGYTAYSPTKFAIRGFAEALQSEVRRDGITISLSTPPETDTPMLTEASKNKPKETVLIAGAAGLMQPNAIAKVMVEKALQQRPPFFIYFGLEGWMMQQLTAGMSPVTGLVDGMCQVFLMGFFRFISLFYLWDFARIIAKCGKAKKDSSL